MMSIVMRDVADAEFVDQLCVFLRMESHLDDFYENTESVVVVVGTKIPSTCSAGCIPELL